MTALTLTREYSDDHTYGVLTASSLTLQTLERPRIDSHPCVPEGVYGLVMHDTPTHPQTWALVNPALGVYHEPDDIRDIPAARFAILIHTGNTVADSEGCILVGLLRDQMMGKPAVMASRPAFAQLKAVLPWMNGHTLTVTS